MRHSVFYGAFIAIDGPGGGGTPYNGLYGEAPPERGTFFKLQVYKKVGKSVIRYLKGHVIKIFRISAPYGCISLFIKHYMKMTLQGFRKGVQCSKVGMLKGYLFCKRYIKGVPFFNKRYIKG